MLGEINIYLHGKFGLQGIGASCRGSLEPALWAIGSCGGGFRPDPEQGSVLRGVSFRPNGGFRSGTRRSDRWSRLSHRATARHPEQGSVLRPVSFRPNGRFRSGTSRSDRWSRLSHRATARHPEQGSVLRGVSFRPNGGFRSGTRRSDPWSRLSHRATARHPEQGSVLRGCSGLLGAAGVRGFTSHVPVLHPFGAALAALARSNLLLANL
jgi:hypothetical protein